MKLFERYPRLESGRLVLRRMTREDADQLKSLTESSRIYATLPTFLYELRYEDKREVIARMDEECFDCGESVMLGIFRKDGGGSDAAGHPAGCTDAAGHPAGCGTPDAAELIGIAEIYNYEAKKDKASIGCRLKESAWGRGYATEVIGLLRDYLIEDLDFRTVTAHILRTNGASAGAARKCGFVDKYPGLWEDWGFEDLMLTDKYVYKRGWPKVAAPHHLSVDVEQFVMAYGVEQDRIRALLPDGYESLRAVLRINAEIRDGEKVYIELNTPVVCGSRRGWLNIANWKSTNDPGISFEREGKTTRFSAPFLSLEFTGTGALGGCPAEKDNQGCFYLGNDVEFRPAEKIDAPREYCRCSFAWRFREDDARGKSADDGRSLAAKSDPPKNHYEPCECTAENAAAIPCEQVLGAYTVRFVREPVG